MEELKYIDTHSHIHFSDFDADREEMMARMQEQGVGTIAIGTDLETSRQVLELASKHSNIWACIGLHPNDHDEDFNKDSYKKLLAGYGDDKKLVAIGECGLDYFRMSHVEEGGASAQQEKDRQKSNFKAQIEWAIELELPLMLHIRSSEASQDAHDDALEILSEYKAKYDDKLKIHSHFTTFGLELGKRFLELGATFGIPGVVTYKSAPELQELVQFLPLESITVETDAPYAAPVPHRGKRNESVFVVDIIRYIAELRGESEQLVQEQLLKNSKRVFKLL